MTDAGGPRVSSTVCPGRVLERNRWTVSLIHWWQFSSPWDVSAGQPCGPPEWPEAGGMMHQDAWLVDAVTLLRSEWPHVGSARDSVAVRH